MTYQDTYGHFFEYIASISGLNDGEAYFVKVNTVIHAQDEIDNFKYCKICISPAGGQLYIQIRRGNPTPAGAQECLYQTIYPGGNPGAFLLRVVFKEDWINVYIDHRLVLSWQASYVRWQAPTRAWFYAWPEGVTMTHSYVVPELNSPRDGMYVDLESTGMNAAESVIQQRPVEIIDNYRGGLGQRLQFYVKKWMQQSKTVPAVLIQQHTNRQGVSTQAAGEVIVYASDVQVVEDQTYLGDQGFKTIIYRMPDLDTDAASAARIAIGKARSSEEVQELSLRFDPSLQRGDGIHFSYTKANGLIVERQFIIDSISISIASAKATMVVSGYLTY